MPEPGDLAEHGCRRCGARAPLAARQHLARHAVGERRLADAFGTDHQPGMVQPAACERSIGIQRAPRSWPNDLCHLARRREPFQPIRFFGRSLAPSRRQRRLMGCKRSTTASQISSATSASGLLASITTQRRGLLLGDIEKGSADPVMLRRSPGSRSDPALRASPRPGARSPSSTGMSSTKVKLGLSPLQRHALERADQSRRHAAGGALISARGIEEAVADDPVPWARASLMTAST